MSFRHFTDKDLQLIEQEWQELKALAEPRCRTAEEFEIVRKAFDFANTSHVNVRRRSGTPYIIHPIEVAKIVVGEIGLGYKSITAALLHDVVEDSSYTIDDIRNLFGDKIASLVDGLNKIKTVLDNDSRNKVSTVASESQQAENFRRILLSIGDDVRVVLIKLADRLHNCRTIENLTEHKRDKVLSETMYIFIPLAHRLGLYSIKSEMENIWLRYKEPEEYAEICDKISRNVTLRAQEIEEFISPIEMSLKSRGYVYEIKKRIKTPYSIWHKMHTKNVPFEEIYDLYAVRIIYESFSGSIEDERDDAFRIYNMLSSLYRTKPDRWRNWIEHPKSNGYEAIHCTLMSHAGVWIEVQIRSRRMDDIAEKGIAAHWAYKNNGYSSEEGSSMDNWLAKVQEILSSDDVGTRELLDIIHNDLVASDIVVFTPKGDQRSIQAGATALDFAYAIHSHIGEKAIACKINMKLMPLSTELKSGDQIEIITAANAKPKVEWLQFLKTRLARTRVSEFFRPHRDEIIASGESIYNERLKAMDVRDTNAVLKHFLSLTHINDRSEFFYRVGLGIIGPEEFRKIISAGRSTASFDGELIIGDGGSDRKFIMADCCRPIPGDPVIGFILDDGSIMVHKKSCPEAQSLASTFSDRMVEPQWTDSNLDYPVRVTLKGIDRVGMLNEITQCISLAMEMNIRKLTLASDQGLFNGSIELFVRDKSKLKQLIDNLLKIDGIQDVVRTDIPE